MHRIRARCLAAGLMAAFAGLAHAASGANCAKAVGVPIEVPGGTVCASIDDPALSLRQPLLRDWIERSARIVAEYYGTFPAPFVILDVHGAPGGGVRGGRTSDESGLRIQVTVGRDATGEELTQDWVLVHEMVHLALPEVGRRHNWLAEGIATYVEGIARARFGNRDIADVWAEYRHSMPLGLPHAGEGGMDQTATWGRTYWGGALYCLQADIAIREQTGNRAGLQTALRAILRGTGGFAAERHIDQVLALGDAATGTRVLENLYGEIKTTALRPDLDLLWSRLGIPKNPKSEAFDDRAPLAAVRIAITARQPGR